MTNQSITIITQANRLYHHSYIQMIAELAKVIANTEYATVYSVDKRLVQNHIQKPIKIATIIQGGIHFVK